MHWDEEAFPVDQLFETFQQLRHLNQHTGMVFVIFCAQSMAGLYAKCLHQDPHITHMAFGAMTVQHAWTTMQKWVMNNWESYLIIHCSGINDLIFNHNQDNLLLYTLFTAPPCWFVMTPDGKSVNYGQKPVEAMQCLVLQFLNLGNTIIDAFAGTHTSSLAALLCHCNSIMFEASQEQWTAAQAILPDHFLALSNAKPRPNKKSKEEMPDLWDSTGLPVLELTPPSPLFDPTLSPLTTSSSTAPLKDEPSPDGNSLHCAKCHKINDEENLEICLDPNCLKHFHVACSPDGKRCSTACTLSIVPNSA
jgi:hypothetical protein